MTENMEQLQDVEPTLFYFLIKCMQLIAVSLSPKKMRWNKTLLKKINYGSKDRGIMSSKTIWAR